MDGQMFDILTRPTINSEMHLRIVWILQLLIVNFARSEDRRSNILFIIVDDLRTSLGCYGDAKAYTPNVDRLAQQSVLFQRAYAQQALCAPSRNSLLTSRRPDTLGLYDFYSYWRDVAGNFTTLPQHLKDNGYTTASFGKVFHPGASCNHSDDSPFSWSKKPFHPYTERYKDAPLCPSRNAPPADNLVCPINVSSMPNATLPDIETLEAAKRFLNEDNKRPFFLAVGFQKPHIPLKYPKQFLKFHPLHKFSVPSNYKWPENISSVAYNPWTDLRRRKDVVELGLKCPWQSIPRKYARRIIQSYYAAVSFVDDLIGQILNELHLLKISDKTVTILTSDHGWSLGEHAEWAKYSNFEVSVRVPLIISIPDMTFGKNSGLCADGTMNFRAESQNLSGPFLSQCKNNRIVNTPVELLDVFPTLAELADAPIPKCQRNQSNKSMLNTCSEGTSLVSLITSTRKSQSSTLEKFAISQYPRPGLEPKCEPSSDEPRLREISIMGYTLRTVQYRYTAWVEFSPVSKNANWKKILAEELYNHYSDPDENSNLANFEYFGEIKSGLKHKLIRRLRDNIFSP
ncbi:hypothetical protein QAD02_012000 [Eretmocerus hayati]|uniref:Uncharacterized protein n=1 Tax=Eretmocerus hayati TaxID=131215 RepID=A0ACC2NYS4_9HYME|nr:hypothetical protein QAD02_012000 [Eretmocerus hayati]